MKRKLKNLVKRLLGKGDLTFHIDTVSSDLVAGWAVNSANPSAPCEVVLKTGDKGYLLKQKPLPCAKILLLLVLVTGVMALRYNLICCRFLQRRAKHTFTLMVNELQRSLFRSKVALQIYWANFPLRSKEEWMHYLLFKTNECKESSIILKSS